MYVRVHMHARVCIRTLNIGKINIRIIGSITQQICSKRSNTLSKMHLEIAQF